MQEIFIHYVNSYGVYAIFASLAIGVLTALAPCSIVTLPLLVGSAVTLSSDLDKRSRKIFIYKYSLLFVLGLIISFSILMLIVAKLGVMLSIAPFWAYALASIATFMVVFYSLGWIGSINKDRIAKRLLKYKLFGAVIIGLIFGLVSSPCATAPLIAIITVAEHTNWVYSYLLVLSFAIGHATLLLGAGVSIGFAQSIASNRVLNSINRYINAIFIVVLILIAIYFAYKAYLIF